MRYNKYQGGCFLDKQEWKQTFYNVIYIESGKQEKEKRKLNAADVVQLKE